MKISKAVLFLTSSLSLSNPAQGEDIVQVHGSGTTNPSKCIWHIMSLFNQRSKVPIRMTYRAVGSSTGQAEFLGVNNTASADDDGDFLHWPHTDFGAGDIPVSSSSYDALNKSPTGISAKKMVHLPFALSSVSFFYNLDGVEEVDLDGCLLAKIFSRKITNWNDPEIVKANPSLSGRDDEIRVCRRTYGSSSTKSITKFLNIQCESEWSDDMIGSDLGDKWHSETVAVEGSGGMTTCITEKDGSIGYLESGHGWSESLQEISLQNKDGFYVTSKQAFKDGGIANAAEDPVGPFSALDDWGKVEFINMGGRTTFPIVLMSYIYVRTDISLFMQDVHDRGLLKLFLESLYMNEYIGKCNQLAFTAVPKSIKDTAEEGIQQHIKWNFVTADNPSGKNPWAFEVGIVKYFGTGDYVISSKRQSYQGVVLNDVLAMEQAEQEKLDELNELGYEIIDFTSINANHIRAALVLSALSFTLWMCAFVFWVVNRFLCGGNLGAGNQYKAPVHQRGDQI